MRKNHHGAILIGVLLFAMACATRSPLESLKKDLDRYPEYSIILEDMREEGNFFKEYYHRYKLVTAEETGIKDSLLYRTETTDWFRIDKNEYRRYENNLGMVLASKTRDGNISTDQYPPGYQYVGDQRYGQWRTDSQGNSFWEFYGKYAFISHMFGMFNRPIYQNDYREYRDFRQSGRPYYGPNREYGTNGKYTKHTNKSFFERRMQREQRSRTRFSDKVSGRKRRSNMSNVRRRSSRGFGK